MDGANSTCYRNVLESLSRFGFLKSLPLQSICHVLPSELSKKKCPSVFTKKSSSLVKHSKIFIIWLQFSLKPLSFPFSPIIPMFYHYIKLLSGPMRHQVLSNLCSPCLECFLHFFTWQTLSRPPRFSSKFFVSKF